MAAYHILTLALQPGALLTLEREPGFSTTASSRLSSTPSPAPVSNEMRDLESDLESTFAANPDLFLIKLGLAGPSLPMHPTLHFWRDYASLFCRKLLLLSNVESLRGNARVPLTGDDIRLLLDAAPPMSGSEYLGPDVLNRYWDDLHREFQRNLSVTQVSVEDWFNSLAGAAREIGRIHFHLVENKTGDFPFAFLATYGTHVGSKGRTQHLPLRHALEEFRGDARKQLQALKAIHRAAQGSAWVKKLLESGEIFHPLAWTPTQAHRFLKDLEIFSEAGILCRIPDWWRGARKGPRMRMVVGESAAAGLGMEALLDYRPELTLEGEALSEEDLRRLAETGEELALIKGKWVVVDAEKIGRSLDLFKRARKLTQGGKMTLADALRLLGGAGGHSPMGGEDGEVETSAGAWLTGLLEKMRNPKLVRAVEPGPSFHGTLRPYQQLGLNWLHFLHQLGFGACLADDMGLGKTVQVLALLQSLKDAQPEKSLSVLLVAPASLLHNWISEATRFTPGLSAYAAHSAFEKESAKSTSGRDKKSSQEKSNAGKTPVGGSTAGPDADLVVTTYGMIERSAWIKNRNWNLIILDEAQAIKNPSSQQTRAVKALESERRLVLTGTPVENRLFDLWSIFDFLNPGLLGGADEFRKRAKHLQENPEGYGRLRNVVQPYILRRLKTDKSLLPDLPDKVEQKVYAALGKKQVALYRGLVKKLADALEGTAGMKRRGLILAFLTKFKQVCNHPDHYSGSGVYKEADSGKFSVLREICEPILDKHERLLVFTQYAEITAPLADYLAGLFGRPGLVLTGATPVGKRRALVDTFQGDAYIPFLVLSLKAGGTGLNLTRANHVVHFDRWWNPAVENQATDRAFRLGQKKNVMVHKFITRGTLEEKIDALIESKHQLARDILPSGNEDWITEMSDRQIVEMFTLDAREE